MKILLLLVLMPLQAFAYVYPPEYVYQQWIEHNEKVKTFEYIRTYRLIDQDGHVKDKIEKQEKVYIQRPGQVRIENQNEQEVRIVNQQKAFIQNKNNRREMPLDELLFPLEFLLAFDDADALKVRMNQFYTPVHHFRWFLHEGQKHWMQGSQKTAFFLFSSEEFIPKVIQKKDALHQLIYPNTKNENYTLPSKIIIFEDEKPIAEVQITNIKINSNINQSQFISP